MSGTFGAVTGVHATVPICIFKRQCISPIHARRKDSWARRADRSKRPPTTLGQQMYPRNGGHLRHFLGISWAMPLTVIYMIAFSNQILLVSSLYDLRCIILKIGKQIIAFKKGTFAPAAPPTQKQEGCLLLPAPPLRRAWSYRHRSK